MWWLKMLAAGALFIGSSAAFVLGSSERVPLHSKPDSTSAVTTLLSLRIPYEIERVEGPWTEVSQGSVLGWVRTECLPLSGTLPLDTGRRPHKVPEFAPLVVRSANFSSRGSFTGFAQFVVGNQELRMKMRDPSFRDRVVAIASEWGPFFSVRTRHYYVKGIYLKRMLRDQLSLRLAKRRVSYSEMFGSLWSDEFLKVVIDSNRGLLGNEQIFGKGREYFLELSFRF